MGPISLEDWAIATKVLRAKELMGVEAAVKRDIMDHNRGLVARRCPESLLSTGRKGVETEVDSY
jgi:hypothetical protein